jgi:hypothetical protein
VIVKVQVALSGPTPLVLVYDRSHKFEYHGPMTDDLKLLMGARVKAFFVAHIDEQGRFSLGQEATWQVW